MFPGENVLYIPRFSQRYPGFPYFKKTKKHSFFIPGVIFMRGFPQICVSVCASLCGVWTEDRSVDGMLVWLVYSGYIHGGFDSKCPIVTIIVSVWGLLSIIQVQYVDFFFLFHLFLTRGESSRYMHEGSRHSKRKIKLTDAEKTLVLLLNIVSISHSVHFATCFSILEG